MSHLTGITGPSKAFVDEAALHLHHELLPSLPRELSDLLGLFYSTHDTAYHILKDRANEVGQILETEKKHSIQGTEVKIPLPESLFVRLRAAIGYDTEGKMLISDVDYDALGDVLAKLMINPQTRGIIKPWLTKNMKLFFVNLAKTEGGARAIYKVIHYRIFTQDDHVSLHKLLPDLKLLEWGGFAIDEMIEKNIFTSADKETLLTLLPHLKKTTGGKSAVCTMVQKRILTRAEVGKLAA